MATVSSPLRLLRADDDGAISLKRVMAAPETPSPKLTPTTAALEILPIDLATDQEVISLSKLTFSQQPQVPPVPTAEQLRAAGIAAAAATRISVSAVSTPSVVGRMKVNDVLLTSGDDEAAGVISIPNLLPVPDDGVDPAGARRRAEKAAQAQCEPDRQAIRNQRQMARQSKPPSKIGTGFRKVFGHFVEFYDPEAERIDVDDYNMPILLVAAQEEINDDSKDQGARKLLTRKLTDIQPTLAYAWGSEDRTDLPADFHKRMDNGVYEQTIAPRMVLQWAPTNLWYNPLYFEDPALERYGHSRRDCIQPFVSSGRFLGQVAGLPYQMVLHPPKCPEYALGYYQPGEWAPKKKYQIPFNEEAAATEFLWITALILIIP